ncbi:probable ATP-binding cassette sub-family F member 3 [Rhynchosporium secalis]|uniref:Probable ATP-binding cassette sub-family F member 3 n=1 Tax=Rhynchosporium secalis TaxID=38038 RepID=A0A1E1MSQ3_RHYSE|nr:probable ATP-binding cassette sub-family F member 3 [Rhynchosporium secalis]
MALTTEEAATTTLVSCKQTRFHIENPVYQELDIEGLNITVASSGQAATTARSKSRASAEVLEILSNATLKLKAGVHYALIGRNGTGKSTILKAVAEKLIPGIPIQTRISILQQTSSDGSEDRTDITKSLRNIEVSEKSLSVLEAVIDRATSKSEIQREIDILSKAIDTPESAFSPLRALRRVLHDRLKKELFEHDKDARLRSGTRGMAARKALIAFEKKIAESEGSVNQTDEEIDEKAVKEETQIASDLLVDLQSQIEPGRIVEIEVKARKILSGLGFPKSHLGKPVSTLSGGWKMRTNLACVLLQPTDILILDEPTNFLDLLGIIWFQKYLLQLRDSGPDPPSVVLVSHDREFINTVCQELIVLRDQDLTYFRGDLTAYDHSIRDKKLYLTRMKEAQDKQKTHIQNTIAQNIKQGKAAGDENKLRQAKSRQKKLDNRMGMEKSATGGRFKLNRDLAGYHLTARAEIDMPLEEKGVSILLPPPPDLRFPGPLISLENVTFSYPVLKKPEPKAPPVLQDINLTIHTSDRIAILGLNGSGKSTIIKLLASTISTSPSTTKGNITRHPRLRLGYYSQHSVEDLQITGRATPPLTALSLLNSDVKGELDEGEVRGLLGSLGLAGRTASEVPLMKLSGGQLVRLALARILWKSPQLLILDEITTHLDSHTVTALVDALSVWSGAVVVVSHDRYLVRRVVMGERESEGSENEDEGEGAGEDEVARRRVVYLLKGGELKVLERGVGEFEESLERRVEKLLDSRSRI